MNDLRRILEQLQGAVLMMAAFIVAGWVILALGAGIGNLVLLVVGALG